MGDNMPENFQLGAIPSKKDDRDYSIKVKTAPCVQVFSKDYLITMFKEHYYQEHGTCVAQAIRALLKKYYGIDFGIEMTYGGGRVAYTGQGLYPNEAVNFVCTNGIARLVDDPKEFEVPEAISYFNTNKAFYLAAGADFKDAKWARVKTREEMKAVIASDIPVLVCLPLSHTYPLQMTYILPYNPAQIFGYHEVLVIGWKEIAGVEYFRIFNSWGDGWGLGGDCYISWEQINDVNDLIVLSPKKENEFFTIQRTLRWGHTGEDVKDAQEKLIALGYDCGSAGADGVFGEKTLEAVKTLQQDYKATINGYITQQIWYILNNDLKPEPEPDPENKDINIISLLIRLIRNLIQKLFGKKINSLNP
jgi:hypothetical protein